MDNPGLFVSTYLWLIVALAATMLVALFFVIWFATDRRSAHDRNRRLLMLRATLFAALGAAVCVAAFIPVGVKAAAERTAYEQQVGLWLETEHGVVATPDQIHRLTASDTEHVKVNGVKRFANLTDDGTSLILLLDRAGR